MSEERKRKGGTGILIAVVLIPLLYVLSIGPAVMLVNKTKISSKPFEVFYAPVIWVAENTSLEKPLNRYAEWWLDR